MVILKTQYPIYFPVHGLPMGALPVEAAAGGAFGKMLLSEVHVGWDTVLNCFFSAFLEPPVAFQAGGKRTEAAFIQSQSADDLLYLRLEAVALDELPRLLPDLPILDRPLVPPGGMEKPRYSKVAPVWAERTRPA